MYVYSLSCGCHISLNIHYASSYTYGPKPMLSIGAYGPQILEKKDSRLKYALVYGDSRQVPICLYAWRAHTLRTLSVAVKSLSSLTKA